MFPQAYDSLRSIIFHSLCLQLWMSSFLSRIILLDNLTNISLIAAVHLWVGSLDDENILAIEFMLDLLAVALERVCFFAYVWLIVIDELIILFQPFLRNINLIPFIFVGLNSGLRYWDLFLHAFIQKLWYSILTLLTVVTGMISAVAIFLIYTVIFIEFTFKLEDSLAQFFPTRCF